MNLSKDAGYYRIVGVLPDRQRAKRMRNTSNAHLGGLLNIKAAADKLGISSKTLYKYVSAGKITCIKSSARCVRFSDAQIQAYKNRYRVASRWGAGNERSAIIK